MPALEGISEVMATEAEYGDRKDVELAARTARRPKAQRVQHTCNRGRTSAVHQGHHRSPETGRQVLRIGGVNRNRVPR